MRLFRTWSKEKILRAIQDLEESLALGISQSSNPSHGSLSYTNPDNARMILRSLYRRLDELDGNKPDRIGPRQWTLISRGSF